MKGDSIIMSNEIVKNQSTDEVAAPSDLARGGVATTIDMSTMKGKVEVYQALADSESIADHLEEPFKLKDIIFQGVEVTSQQTGAITPATRTILVADDGRRFSTVSDTIVSDLRTLTAIFGSPETWDEPLDVSVEERRGNNKNRFYKLVTAFGDLGDKPASKTQKA